MPTSMGPDIEAALPLEFYDRKTAFNATRGDLPHRDKSGLVQFVTFRLADSLPKEKTRELDVLKANFEALYPKPWDDHVQRMVKSALERASSRLLHLGYGDCILRNPANRRIVERGLLHFDGKRYQLHSCVIMPNHVHMVLTAIDGNELADILHSLKSYTAKELNKTKGTSGPIWQRESFDHFVRNSKEMLRVLQYIRDNPRRLPESSFSYYISPLMLQLYPPITN